MSSWSLEEHGRLAVLTFRREPSNWMDFVSMGELADHLAAIAERTDEISVVMLTGGLDGFFIAHADLDDLAALASGGEVAGDPAVVDPGALAAGVDAAAHRGGDRRSGVGRWLRDVAGLHDAHRLGRGPTSASRRS